VVVRVEMEMVEKNKRRGGDDGVVMVVKTVLEKVVELSPEWSLEMLPEWSPEGLSER